ncbi:hypothetical protein N7478_010084 [Penicillium angulare]|uniref:uncharacterized protein n=1 Tax=Penicillium angulare TaxID=116970 RepID=UPI00253F78CE|nr:uncharacterized protein N7478_010084 [Penicillium angulare]KAJ5267276.1 hypothetical protein N7478_010084 [Penicillium angulare]
MSALISQSQDSCIDSDIGLNFTSDPSYPDNISDFIGSQTPLTSFSQTQTPVAPTSLIRLGPYLQKHWIPYPSDSSYGNMEETRKKFVDWWLTTEFGSQPQTRKEIHWEGKATSDVWDSFQQVAHEKSGKPRVMCKSCLCTIGHPRFRRAGSSPMNAHLKTSTCPRKPTPKKGIDQLVKEMPSGPAKQSFSQDQLSKAILSFITTAHLPFRLIEHPQFRNLVDIIQQASTKITVPSARTIRRCLDLVVSESQKQTLAKLPNGSRLSIALDCWTSPFQQAFMAVTGYFLDQKWNYCEVLLGFEHLHGSHTGENLSKTVTQLLADHGISDRVLSVTTDNATNNNTLMTGVQDTLQAQCSRRSDPLIFRVPCIVHVIQLSLTELLGKLKAAPSNKQIDLEWSDERTQSFQSKRSSNHVQITETLRKIRGLAVFINASPRRREAFMALQTTDTPLIPIQDVQTRWNSTFLMLNRAKRLQRFYDQYCIDHQYLHFKLDQEEWRQVDYLLLLTKPFFDFTTVLSQTKDITVHNIFSIYNKLFSHLDTAESKLKNKGVIWKRHMLQALQTAKTKLSKYYTATDYEPYGDIYAFATILCPSKKLRYFSSSDWQGDIDYVKHYHEVLKQEFDRYKARLYEGLESTALEDPSGESADDSDYDLDAICASQNQIPEETILPQDDEIARYLARGIERQKPRVYWKEHESDFPILANMARDILSIPASGAGVERLFNCARDICHYRRGQLKPSTVRALMLHQFATNFDLKQEELDAIKEYLSDSEAALMDQARKPSPPLEILEPISDNKEDEDPGVEDIQQCIQGAGEDDLDNTEQHRRGKGRQSRKRSSDDLGEQEDDGAPDVSIESSQMRPGRARKQPRLPDGFELL